MKLLLVEAVFTFLFVISSVKTELFARQCGCEKGFKPVCGTDGVTYDNLCSLRCNSSNGTLLAYAGTCCPKSMCPMHRNPMCDNYGRTYANECVFTRVQCLMRKALGRMLTKKHDGECLPNERQPEDCNADCLFSNDTAVCDENGVTHENECKFEKMNCRLRNTGKPEILLQYYGECESVDIITTTAINEALAEGSGEMPNKEIVAENDSTVRELESAQITETVLPMSHLHNGDVKSENELVAARKAVKARAVPSLFLDDIDSLNDSEQAVLGLKKSDLVSGDSHPKHGAAEISYGGQIPHNEDTVSMAPDDFLSSTSIAPAAAEHRTDRSIDAKPPSKVISMPSASQHFDMTQPCSAAECDKSKNPVCDSNNRTHKNMCMFKFYACKVNRLDGSTVELAHVGECTAETNLEEKMCPQCPVSKTDVVVCDNLNKTHHSLCDLARFNCVQRSRGEDERVLVHVGRCHSRTIPFTLKEEECPKSCSSDRKPVCDTQGNTFKNLCLFQQSNCLIRKKGKMAPTLLALKSCAEAGYSVTPTTDVRSRAKVEPSLPPEVSSATAAFECPPPSCSLDGQPVCDTQGVLHENICVFVHARCLAARKGLMLSIQREENCLKSQCDQECSTREKPVCGSNFITYKNICHFNKQRCKEDSLTVLFYGKCEECLASPCPPAPANATDEHFVCDEDGNTRTVCEFQMLSCIVERSLGTNISVQHLGRCCEVDKSCTEDSPPLCGSDGRTYANKCALKLENCRGAKLEMPQVTTAHLGSCDGVKGVVRGVSSEESSSSDESDEDDKKRSEGISNCPTTCNNIYSPVCGTDDVTYTNLCQMRLKQCRRGTTIGLAYKGECCTMDCPNNFSPVCDDRGITHQNLCTFGKERCIVEKVTGKNITISKFDVCDENSCQKECDMTYKPICASNGETLINECYLEKLNCILAKRLSGDVPVKKLYNGECCPNENCGYDFSPVCDSLGETHANECVFRRTACLKQRKANVSINIQYKGLCCNRQCSDEYLPVCDGNRTYQNICEFKIAQCEAERHGQVFMLAYPGECCSLPKGKCEATGSVCDSNGQTHVNMCHFMQKTCVLNRTMKKSLSVIHTGECCTIEVCHKGDSSPVCDTRGGTHATKCHFQNTKCIHDKIHPNNPINLAYNGACCLNDCDGVPDDFVCDQHGNMYRNRCHFKYKACERLRRINSILLETPCPEQRLARSVRRTIS